MWVAFYAMSAVFMIAMLGMFIESRQKSRRGKDLENFSCQLLKKIYHQDSPGDK